MNLTTRCGTAAIDGLNEALLTKAVEAKVLRTSRYGPTPWLSRRNVAYPTDSGLLAKAVKWTEIARLTRQLQIVW